jgi:hypothetical protein
MIRGIRPIWGHPIAQAIGYRIEEIYGVFQNAKTGTFQADARFRSPLRGQNSLSHLRQTGENDE